MSDHSRYLRRDFVPRDDIAAWEEHQPRLDECSVCHGALGPVLVIRDRPSGAHGRRFRYAFCLECSRWDLIECRPERHRSCSLMRLVTSVRVKRSYVR